MPEEEGLVTKETEFTKGRLEIFTRLRKKAAGSLMNGCWPVEEQPVRSELLLKLFFAGDLPLENRREKLDNI
jgi:hypothetical protein